MLNATSRVLYAIDTIFKKIKHFFRGKGDVQLVKLWTYIIVESVNTL